MKLDYETNIQSEHSGSVVFINQDSPLLNDEDEELGHTMVVSSVIKNKIEEGKKDDTK